MSCLTGHRRANHSPSYHHTFFSEIIHNADASNTHRGPGYKYGCVQRTVRHFPKIKRKTQLSKNRGNPAYTFDYSLYLALHSIFSLLLTMLAMGGLYLKHVVVAAVCSVLATGTLGSPVVGPEPIRCAPCTPEKLSQCPAVAPECAEVLREPGCGCCLACALTAGELCGIYTAPCGSGLRCTPRPDDPRPLHSLTRGQAVCTETTVPAPTPEPQTQGRPVTCTFIHLCHHIQRTLAPAIQTHTCLVYSEAAQPHSFISLLQIRQSQRRRWRTQPSSRTPAPASTSPATVSPTTRGLQPTLRRA